MVHFTTAAKAALLNWINTFDLKQRAKSLGDLTDGLILGEVLNKLCAGAGFDGVTLNEKASLQSDKKHNLETVHRGLGRLLRFQDNADLAPSPSRFRAIVEKPTDDGMCEFLSALVAAACMGPQSQLYVPKVLKLLSTEQHEIAAVILRKQQQRKEAGRILAEGQKEEKLDNSSGLDDGSIGDSRDQDLAMAEEMQRLKWENEKLKRQGADLLTRHDSMVGKYSNLNAALRETQTELETLRMTQASGIPKAIQRLENEKRENSATIDYLQTQIADYQVEVGKLGREVQQLKPKVERAKELDDRLQMLEYERREAEKNERVLENYKRKAKECTNYQHLIRELREQNNELRAALAKAETLETQNRALEQSINVFRNKFASYEQAMHEASLMRSGLQSTITDLRSELETVHSRRMMDEQMIKELEEKLQTVDFMPADASPEPCNANLDREMETANEAGATTMRLENKRLKLEAEILKNNMGVKAEVEKLKMERDKAMRRASHLERCYHEMLEKHGVAQEQINVLIREAPDQERLVACMDRLMAIGRLRLLTPGYFRDESFILMRSDCIRSERELKEARDKIQKLEAEACAKDRRLAALQTDLDAVGQDARDALETLKKGDELISHTLRDELYATRRQLETKDMDYDVLRNRTKELLIEKDECRQQLDKVAGVGQQPTRSAPASEECRPKEQEAEKNEKLRAALKQMMQLEQCEQEKYDLQRRLKDTADRSFLAAEKVANEQMIQILQRENALITTAWYNVTSRLQSNLVFFQRRNDMSRTWLGKQRQMVNGEHVESCRERSESNNHAGPHE